jgi:uncharacterized surface protein with fasciclin (FAS1) repeats
MKLIDAVAAVLVVGAFNWGLVAVARFDPVAALFGLSFREGLRIDRRGLRTGRCDWSVPGALLEARTEPVDAAGKPPRVIQQLVGSYSRGAHMKTMLTFTSLAIVAMLAAAPARAQQTKDIVDTAVAAGSFTTLAKALTAADVVATLKEPGPFTVFAPTDEAFAKLPAGTLNNLLKPENKAMLQRVLTYHVVPGKVLAADVVKVSSAKAVSGDSLPITVSGSAVMVGKARVVKTDIVASNGVIHVIDTVLLPPGE